ncbi:MAG: MotA/TolQ/ExbB proton channel family protein [Bacteroidota bacterium]|jgi:biopolymer transport protein ExbB
MILPILQVVAPTGNVNAADSLQKASEALNNVANQTKPDNFDFSVWSMIMNGGVIMIPIGILFVLTLFVLIERLLVVNKAISKNSNLINSVRELIHKGNIDSAKAMCKSNPIPENIMIEKGISRIGQPVSEIREAMNDTAKVEIGKLERRLGLLSVCGKIAPLLGFIGTIIGVIKIFYDINHAGKVDIEHVSGGLYVKMVSSAGGLVVGVIAFIAYHWVNSMIDRVALKMEESMVQFIDILQEPNNS